MVMTCQNMPEAKNAEMCPSREDNTCYFDERNKDIIKEILGSPLIAPHNTMRELSARPIIFGGKVYFGTGVATTRKISQGMPLDSLNLVLAAEWIRRKTNATEIVHEISDVHALANDYCDLESVLSIAKEQKRKYIQIAHNLGMDNHYRCVRASEYRETQEFKKIQAQIDVLSKPDASEYERCQSAGNLYFARFHGITQKVGWLVDDNDRLAGYDERKFNKTYKDLGVDPISFAYTWSGWNFDERRARVSPYTFVEGEKRLLMESTNTAHDELAALVSECNNAKIANRVLAHLSRLVDSYEMMYPTKKYEKNKEGILFLLGIKKRNLKLKKQEEEEILGNLADKIEKIRRRLNAPIASCSNSLTPSISAA